MTPSLFLGCSLDRLNPTAGAELLKLFTSGGVYLEKITYNQTLYLGKYAASFTSIDDLALLEANVTSLLKRLSPDFEERPCLLTLCSS